MPPLRLYVDENVDQRIVPDLRNTGCDVLTVPEAGAEKQTDEAQLLFATAGRRLLLTHNQIHFRRLHRRIVRAGGRHAGIVLIPQTIPLSRLRIRANLLVAWLATLSDYESQLFTWSDLQQRLIHGYRPPHFVGSEADIRHALGWR